MSSGIKGLMTLRDHALAELKDWQRVCVDTLKPNGWTFTAWQLPFEKDKEHQSAQIMRCSHSTAAIEPCPFRIRFLQNSHGQWTIKDLCVRHSNHRGSDFYRPKNRHIHSDSDEDPDGKAALELGITPEEYRVRVMQKQKERTKHLQGPPGQAKPIAKRRSAGSSSTRPPKSDINLEEHHDSYLKSKFKQDSSTADLPKHGQTFESLEAWEEACKAGTPLDVDWTLRNVSKTEKKCGHVGSNTTHCTGDNFRIRVDQNPDGTWTVTRAIYFHDFGFSDSIEDDPDASRKRAAISAAKRAMASQRPASGRSRSGSLQPNPATRASKSASVSRTNSYLPVKSSKPIDIASPSNQSSITSMDLDDPLASAFSRMKEDASKKRKWSIIDVDNSHDDEEDQQPAPAAKRHASASSEQESQNIKTIKRQTARKSTGNQEAESAAQKKAEPPAEWQLSWANAARKSAPSSRPRALVISSLDDSDEEETETAPKENVEWPALRKQLAANGSRKSAPRVLDDTDPSDPEEDCETLAQKQDERPAPQSARAARKSAGRAISFNSSGSEEELAATKGAEIQRAPLTQPVPSATASKTSAPQYPRLQLAAKSAPKSYPAEYGYDDEEEEGDEEKDDDDEDDEDEPILRSLEKKSSIKAASLSDEMPIAPQKIASTAKKFPRKSMSSGILPRKIMATALPLLGATSDDTEEDGAPGPPGPRKGTFRTATRQEPRMQRLARPMCQANAATSTGQPRAPSPPAPVQPLHASQSPRTVRGPVPVELVNFLRQFEFSEDVTRVASIIFESGLTTPERIKKLSPTLWTRFVSSRLAQHFTEFDVFILTEEVSTWIAQQHK